ncbi:MAG: TolC family protein [Lachnospiraceae bacterium]|nr:TolC family protein [bacterium]MDY5518381.1 TolC family protein [Lachnospiraceae bacterium]
MNHRSQKKVKRSGKHRVLALVLAAVVVVTSMAMWELTDTKAQVRSVYTMSQARAQAYNNSAKLEQLENKLETKKVQLTQAVKTIAMKQKNMSTFRWSPLFSFKFPTKPDLAEAFEFEFKPKSIQYEIDVINHQITDQKFTIYQQVNSVYLDIVMLEQEIDLNEKKLDAAKKSIEKSKLKLLIGKATQEDIDTMNAKCNSLTAKISSASRNLISKKKRLATLTGNNDVLNAYSFENPLVEAEMSRSEVLDKLIQYTLDNDQTYYEAKIAQQSAYVQMTTNYDLMSRQYGSKMSTIRSYYNQALNGEKINAKAFKQAYKEFLKEIDKPWEGKRRILFFKFPKVWFKGAIDGSRYVEDEPYALYESALEYQDARLEAEGVKADLTAQVEEYFDNYVSAKNSYKDSVTQLADAQRQLDRDLLLNKLGTLTYDEYASSLDNYETLQSEMIDCMKTYSSVLYEFDRLTCGAVSEYMEKGSLDLNAADGGESVIIEENVEGSYYYIEQIIQNEEFRLRVQLAEELDGQITDFELWCDDIQIGERTSIDKTLRHLSLAIQSVEVVKIRFYHDGEFVDDCEIDPGTLSGKLEITTGYHVQKSDSMEVGSYTCHRNDTTGFTEVTLTPESQEDICYYLIRTNDGKYLRTEEPLTVATVFKYLSVLEPDLANVTIEFFDASKNKLYDGCFDMTNMKLLKKQEAQ